MSSSVYQDFLFSEPVGPSNITVMVEALKWDNLELHLYQVLLSPLFLMPHISAILNAAYSHSVPAFHRRVPWFLSWIATRFIWISPPRRARFLSGIPKRILPTETVSNCLLRQPKSSKAFRTCAGRIRVVSASTKDRSPRHTSPCPGAYTR